MPYSYRRTVTIDHTLAGGSDSSNFEFMFAGTYAYLATVANSGNVQNSNGYDIIFTSDSAGLTQLAHEIDIYTASNGLVCMWVKIPTLSHTADTVIYLWYGNASISTSQENKSSLWSAASLASHFGDGSTYSLADSSGHYSSPSTSGTLAAAAGQDGGALSFNGSSNYAFLGTTMLDTLTAGTIHLWIYRTASGVLGASPWRYSSFIEKGATYTNFGLLDTNKIRIYYYDGSGHSIDSPTTLSINTWYHLVLTWDSGGTTLYINGAVDTTSALTYTATHSGHLGTTVNIGVQPEGTVQYYTGRMDELRWYTSKLGADWITATYNNQLAPGSFYSISTATSVGGGALFRPGQLTGIGSGGPFFSNPLN